METADFSFNLPEELIAQNPPKERGASRLLCLDRTSDTLNHRSLIDLPALVAPGTLMVFNDSRVRKARVYGTCLSSGATVEFLLLEEQESGLWKVLAKRSKRQRIGRTYQFDESHLASITAEEGEYRFLRFNNPIDEAWLELNGHIPLPPYIRREDAPDDHERYQTVYAKKIGSAAAPTAGLHFTPEILAALDERGVERQFVTLHVGLGTFLPVRTKNIEEHTMHEEHFYISKETADAVVRAKSEKRPVLAVGTTSVRTLESAWRGDFLQSGEGSTSIFMYPGYSFSVVDQLFTNFHTPESTLLMLVSAFAGKERILNAYDEAIRQRYRFFSYGDAMLIT